LPVVAKSDSLTNSELQEYRHLLNQEFKQLGIPIFNLDLTSAELFGETLLSSANTQVKHKGEYLPLPRNRQKGDCLALLTRDGFYPWGASRVHNPDHSDFRLLREKLLCEHTENIIQAARENYASFRARAKQVNKIKNIASSLLLSAFLFRQLLIAFDQEQNYGQQRANLSSSNQKNHLFSFFSHLFAGW